MASSCTLAVLVSNVPRYTLVNSTRLINSVGRKRGIQQSQLMHA